MRLKNYLIIASIFLISTFDRSASYADIAPRPNEITNPCAGKQEGDSCAHFKDTEELQVCKWTVTEDQLPEYMKLRLQHRQTCTQLSKEGEPLKLKCLLCVDKDTRQ